MKKNSSPFLLGAHLSVANGFDKAVHTAVLLGCTAFQIFTKSNRQWKARPISKEEATAFHNALAQSPIQKEHVFVHASYLINLGSPDQKISLQSTHALTEELNRCETLQIPYLVLHPGSHTGSDVTDCLLRIAKNLDLAIKAAQSSVMILLENMAGQGTSVGESFENLAFIYNHVETKNRIGFCFDTCHAFAAGYRFNDKKTYHEMWEEFDQKIGINHIKLIHLNDSKKELGSHVDRHEDIAKGCIGAEAFSLLCNDKRFANIPKILETPKESADDDIRNMKTVFSFIDE